MLYETSIFNKKRIKFRCGGGGGGGGGGSGGGGGGGGGGGCGGGGGDGGGGGGGGSGGGGGIVNHALKILYKAHCLRLAPSFSFRMSVRMVLRSSESQGVFPQNQPWNFQLELSKWLHVTRDWTKELTEFYASNVPKSAKKELYVYCNVCETS